MLLEHKHRVQIKIGADSVGLDTMEQVQWSKYIQPRYNRTMIGANTNVPYTIGKDTNGPYKIKEETIDPDAVEADTSC